MELNQDSQQTSHDLVARNQTNRYTKIVDRIFECVNDHLLMLMNQMLNSADEKLYEQAEAASSEQERLKYTDCTKVFCTEKNDISHHFFINLNKSLAISKQCLPGDDESALVDQDEMDEMVAITTMHSRAMNIYGEEVKHMEARVEYLELMCDDMFDKEAIDPKHICEVFQRTIENIDMAIEVKLIFYKMFDREVCSKLGVMYRTINQIFIDNDIMREIILTTTKNIDIEYIEDNVTSRVAQYYDPEENVTTDFIPRTKEDISRIVNEFMAGDMTITGDEIELPESFLRTPTRQDLEGKNCYQRKEVLRALSKLQRKLTSLQDNTENYSSKEIKQELLKDIGRENNGVSDRHVNLLDERSIDFVGLMFDAISDDETISEIMTSLIHRLQIPVMKVAMSDNTIFNDDQHPARRTVDLLTTAGRGINSKTERLYRRLVTVVDSILDDFESDIKAFKTAVNELQLIIDYEEELARQTEKQQQREILIQHARHIVSSQIKMALSNKVVPASIRPLLLKHWPTLMINRYLKHGRDSTSWSQAVTLLRRLIKCIQPIRLRSQLELVKSSQFSLVDSIDSELQQTRQDKDDIAAQLSALGSHLKLMIDESDLSEHVQDDRAVVQDKDIDQSHSEAEAESRQVRQELEKAKNKIANLMENTRPGVWYEIYNGEDRAVRRLKLSVILNDTAQLVFVDRKGVKVIEKDAAEFAAELEDNRSRMLADHSTFEHALGKVISSLAA